MTKTGKRVRMRAFFAHMILATAAILVMPHAAKGLDHKTYETIKVGIFMPNDTDNATSSTGPTGEIAIGYLFNPFFALEGGIGYFQTELSFRNTDREYKVKGIPLTLSFKSIYPGENFTSSIGIGAGVYFENLETESGSFRINDNDTVLGYHLSLEYDFFIGKRGYAGFEYKVQIIPGSEFHDNSGWVTFDMVSQSLLGTIGYRF